MQSMFSLKYKGQIIFNENISKLILCSSMELKEEDENITEYTLHIEKKKYQMEIVA
jgi:hypothetical protein